MNILPKKSWHVYRRENIERVLRDEAEAKRQEELKDLKKLAEEREARYQLLREKKGLKATSREECEAEEDERKEEKEPRPPEESLGERELLGRYLLGEDVTDKKVGEKRKRDKEPAERARKRKRKDDKGDKDEVKKKGNPDREADERARAAKEDRAFTVYLGQSSAELMHNKPWYEVRRAEKLDMQSVQSVREAVRKDRDDPLRKMKKKLQRSERESSDGRGDERSHGDRKREKKHRRSHSVEERKRYDREDRRSSSSSTDTEQKVNELRRKRLEREAKEREREKALLEEGSTTRRPRSSLPQERAYSGYTSGYNPKVARNSSYTRKRG